MSNTLEKQKIYLERQRELQKIGLESQLELQKIHQESKLKQEKGVHEHAQTMLIAKYEHAQAKLKSENERLDISFKSSEKRNEDLADTIARLRAINDGNSSRNISARGGSVSRALSWESGPVQLRAQPVLSQRNKLSTAEEGVLRDYISVTEGIPESDCYGPLQDTLGCVANTQCFITAGKDGEAPDISICLESSSVANKLLCYGVIEAKRPFEAVETSSHLGQVKDYILSLMQAQPDRHRFWGLHTNMKENILIEIERAYHPGRKYNITKYAPMLWPAVMNYLRDVTTTEDLTPPPLHFARELGNVHDIFDKSNKWRLGVFHIPGLQTKKMVVKNSICSLPKDYHKDELKILRHMKAAGKHNMAPSSVARLVWDPAIRGGDDCYEFVEETYDPFPPRVQFGITLVGDPFNFTAFKTPADFQNSMDSILDGLDWLHNTARIIHRDIRPPNIIMDRMTKLPVIIDFDCAFQLSGDKGGRAKLSPYSGGLICVPPRVLAKALEDFDKGNNPAIQDMVYEPQPSDDLGAFVLLVMAISFPAQFGIFPGYKLKMRGSRKEMEALMELYKGIHRSWTWGTLWEDAQRGDIDELRKVKGHGYWPMQLKTR